MGLTYIGMGKASLALLGGAVAGYTNSSNSVAYSTSSPWTVTPGVSPAWTVSTGTNYGTANVWTGWTCVAGGIGSTPTALVYGTVISNTATALTVDNWYSPSAPGTPVAHPATNSSFILVPGNASCWWMGVGTGAAAAADTSLSGEQSTNGLSRAAATYAHTYSTTSTNTNTTLTNTFTYTGSSSVAIASIGIFDAATSGVPMFTTGLNATATVAANGDTVSITETVTV